MIKVTDLNHFITFNLSNRCKLITLSDELPILLSDKTLIEER